MQRAFDASFAAHQLVRRSKLIISLEMGRAVSIGGWRPSPLMEGGGFSDVAEGLR